MNALNIGAWSGLRSLVREAGFLARDRALLLWVLVVLGLSSVAVWAGLSEVRQQRASIAQLLEADRQDRHSQFAAQSDWGSAAYYSFHLTYDPPADFAFAALGLRDLLPWKHRLRMLALEGQIYEQDVGNPVLALVGRFDFAFLAAMLLPLILIFLLHDLRAAERTAGRHDLLVAVAGNARTVWWWRAGLKSAAIGVAALLPLWVAGLVSGTAPMVLLAATGLVAVHLLFWMAVCVGLAAWQRPAAVILTALVGLWLVLGTLLPAAGRTAIEAAVPIPSGAEILLTQREAVNDAWDLPVAATMRPFLARHPEWAGERPIGEGFDWAWYYAFQQVGDQTAEPLSERYRAGRMERDRLAGLLAWLAPPALVERALQRLARTDLRAALAYEERVRAFHARLRAFYYPGLFRGEPFEPSALARLPEFSADAAAD
ncbi:MAG: DUF3526 domain-containing protein [Cellvibrionales bacterium]|nr:DUF3526 domain-containing protein [Cellvibrionales bacterium]